MKKNVGNLDRSLRILLGVVIIALGVYFQSWWGIVGIIPLLTATMGSCLLYLPFGISTCRTDKAAKSEG